MSLPVLYSFRRCPYAIRARMALAYAAVPVELREVVLKDKPADMLAVSPKGTVPVLVLPGGQLIDESRDIMQWALAQSDAAGWLRAGAEVAEQLVNENDFTFKPLLDRYKYADRHPEQSPAQHRACAETFLQSLEALLCEHHWLCSDSISFADVAVFPFIRQFAFVDKSWFDSADYPLLQQWLNRFLESELFAAAMKKMTPWKRGDAPTVFPENPGCYSKEIG